MKIAITGEKGFLGYHLTEYYKKKCKVINLGKNYLENLHLIRDCDFLIHAAGVNRNPNPNKVYDENVFITKSLVKKLKDLDIKINIKFISSIQEKLDNPYGKSKIKSSEILQNYCDSVNTKLETYRLPNLYGTNGKPNYNSFINTFIYNIINNIPTTVNDNCIDLCWVYDAIEVIDNQKDVYETTNVVVSDVYKTLMNIHKGFFLKKNKFNDNLFLIYNFFKKNNMKILILGHTGMLGHTVLEYFKRNNFKVSITNHRFPSNEFKNDVLCFDGDFIINCIGSIPQRTDDFKINTDLPIWLSNFANTKIIHAGTDCEIDDDNYGKSKKLASEYINLYSTNTKILKTSIIGPEIKSNYGLLEWFLSQDNYVFGFKNAIWNGNTTLEWSKQAHNLIINWYDYKITTILEGESISKYEMLKLFSKIYNKNIEIRLKEMGVDKTLKGDIKTKKLEDQLLELKYFWDTKII